MASTTKLTPLADVKPYRTGWKVQVKVFHTWKQYQTKSGESLEIILGNEMGTKIHATVKKNLLHRFEQMMVVGEWKFIENFSLNQASGQYRTTRHQFKMSFISSTVASKSSKRSDNVSRQVESFCELQIISVMNKDTSKLEFALRNANDERLPCTLWGKLGEEVYSVIVELQVVVKQQSLPENCGRIAFLSSKPQQRVSYGDEIHFDQFPMVIISELQDSLEVVKCKIMCTIYAVDTDWSWFYLDILNQKADEILKGNFDEIQDPDVVPDALQNLIGKTFQFLICVEKENLYGGSNTYKVGKVWKGNDVLSADKVNESEDMGDQSLLLSSNKEIGQNYNKNILDHQHREGHVDYSSLGVEDPKDMYDDVVFPNKYWDSEDEYDYDQRFDCSSLDGSSDEENYIMDKAGEKISSRNLKTMFMMSRV
ncbi:uncharacterized protein LOC112087608 [Eutrema salsugineum]|uniref:uncharacterized protein LOC112087608 n=1 Tax=Eutrema salsugineum TaxID=72664 RepID=UPI000CED52FA|nr:uncharacterized protein LOC112087608 [Eutrema salsugineum]